MADFHNCGKLILIVADYSLSDCGLLIMYK